MTDRIKRIYTRKNIEPMIQEPSMFNINERFGFIKNTIEMVSGGFQNSSIICGSGGLGKSYTVVNTLIEQGYENISSDLGLVAADFPEYKLFRVISGYSTPKALYKTLYDNRNSVVVFDDCDAVLKDATAVNLLKAALDSSENRIISWGSSIKDESLPSTLKFEGRVIFISNMNMMSIDQAIRSRSMTIDVSMTLAEKLERMTCILESGSFLPEHEMEHKVDALELITRLASKVKELTMRSLVQVTNIRAANVSGDWRELSTYVLCG